MFEEVILELDRQIYSLKECLNIWPEDKYREAYAKRNKKLAEFEKAKEILTNYAS
jgi:hypothetical protein